MIFTCSRLQSFWNYNGTKGSLGSWLVMGSRYQQRGIGPIKNPFWKLASANTGKLLGLGLKEKYHPQPLENSVSAFLSEPLQIHRPRAASPQAWHHRGQQPDLIEEHMNPKGRRIKTRGQPLPSNLGVNPCDQKLRVNPCDQKLGVKPCDQKLDQKLGPLLVIKNYVYNLRSPRYKRGEVRNELSCFLTTTLNPFPNAWGSILLCCII